MIFSIHSLFLSIFKVIFRFLFARQHMFRPIVLPVTNFIKCRNTVTSFSGWGIFGTRLTLRANESVTWQKFNLDPCLALVGVLRLTDTSLINCCKIIWSFRFFLFRKQTQKWYANEIEEHLFCCNFFLFFIHSILIFPHFAPVVFVPRLPWEWLK